MTVAPWLQTLGGNALDLCDPKPEQIKLAHMARVLSRVPRFGGHTEGGVLSVAQHMLEGAAAMERAGEPALAVAAFLLHDAHEAYVGDIATPVAEAIAWQAGSQGTGVMGQGIRKAIASLKARLDAAIFARCGLPYPLPPDIAAIVHSYDLRMCRTERDARLAKPPRRWDDAIEAAEPLQGCDLSVWPAATVEALYAKELLTICNADVLSAA